MSQISCSIFLGGEEGMELDFFFRFNIVFDGGIYFFYLDSNASESLFHLLFFLSKDYLWGLCLTS